MLRGLDRAGLWIAQRLLRRVVRFTVSPEDVATLGIDATRPVCYALHIRQLSALLLLEDATRRLGLPPALSPLADGKGGPARERSAFFFLTRSGQPSPLARDPYRYSDRLRRLVEAARADAQMDVQIVPVSIFWGRSPDKQDSILKALFADAWVAPGFFKQTLRLLIHGRQTRVCFGAPLSLRASVDGAQRDHPQSGIAIRRVARLLRGEFRRERELMIGPNLSHRQTVVNAVIDSEPVRAAIHAEAQDRRSGPEQVELRARRIAVEIAADYSPPFIRAYEIGLNALWNKLYDGVEVHHFDTIARTGSGAELVYVPCHRSHIDYLLLSWLIYSRGLPPPHIAAGDNLNLPVIGKLLRRGGAFFLRRSFKGDALYGAVFREYLHTVISRGFPIEYFIEGGRSRSGRTLAPKSGMLAMTVDSHLRDTARPIVFIPVWIGYERLVEGESYLAELAGSPKRRESLLGLLRSLRALRGHFGKVHLNFGEPLALDAFLDAHWPFWRARLDARATTAADDPSPSSAEGTAGRAAPATVDEAGIAQAAQQRHRAIESLAVQLVTRINDALVVNPVNLLALALRDAPRRAMDAGQLAHQIDVLRRLLVEVPHSERQAITPMDGREVVAYAERQHVAHRIAHPLGDIIETSERTAILLGYFASNVLHAYVLPALLATVVARNERVEPLRLAAIARNLLPFLQTEWYLSGDADVLQSRLQRFVEAFFRIGLARSTGAFMTAPAAGQREAIALDRLAQLIRQPLERYFITVSTLSRIGAGKLSARMLEDTCYLLAQRVAYLHEAGGAGFYDRASFRAIIRSLIDLGHVTEVDGLLVPTDTLAGSADDAHYLLSADTRLALGQITQLSDEDVKRAAAALAAAR